MHLGDSIFIFILALVLFGPKKLPEMAKQIGKLMAEFRRASNDFRLQIDEELRTMERQEQIKTQQQKQEADSARLASEATPNILPPAAHGELTAGDSAATQPTLQILPPSLGEQVSAGTPYAVSAAVPQASEDHPLLHVETIPVDPEADSSQATGIAAAEANAARLTSTMAVMTPADTPASEPLPTHPDTFSEAEQAPVHNG